MNDATPLTPPGSSKRGARAKAAPKNAPEGRP
jgi:hypothetical protein